MGRAVSRLAPSAAAGALAGLLILAVANLVAGCSDSRRPAPSIVADDPGGAVSPELVAVEAPTVEAETLANWMWADWLHELEQRQGDPTWEPYAALREVRIVVAQDGIGSGGTGGPCAWACVEWTADRSRATVYAHSIEWVPHELGHLLRTEGPTHGAWYGGRSPASGESPGGAWIVRTLALMGLADPWEAQR